VRSVALAFLGALVAIGACTVKPVTLATLEDDAGTDAAADAFPLDAGPPCVQPSDCPQNFYCAKAHCKSPIGVCMPEPMEISLVEQPVCGCDGLTYFNDSVRQEYGMWSTIPGPGGAPGPCGFGAASCEEPGECPKPYAYCDLLIRNPTATCPPPDAPPPSHPGTCWVLPPICSDAGASGTDGWNPCNAGPNPPCVDTCSAIASEKVYVRARMCP
jgi:hypothetical protein